MSGAERLPSLAAAMADRGLYVFPVSGKHPTTKNGFHDAVGTRPEALELFRQHPWATGIGLDCGRSGLLVVDVDGPNAQEAWTALSAIHGETPTLEATTGRADRGTHLYYATRDPRATNSASKIGPKLDTRGRGGYVLTPPSRHPSGRLYQWSEMRPLAIAPDWLLELLAPPPPPPVGERRPLPSGERLTRYGHVALTGLADRMLDAQEGTRNHTLLEVARRAGRLEAAGELDGGLAAVVLIGAATQAGLSLTEAEKTFRSAFEFGRQYPAARASR